MSTEKLVEKVGQQISRRNFIGKIGASAIVALVGLLGLPKITYAYECCNLCFAPSSPCGTNCPQAWCWTCTDSSSRQWRCCECFTPEATACQGQNCNGVWKSWVACISPNC